MNDRLRCARYWEARGSAPPAVASTLLGDKDRYAPDRSVDTVHVRLELAIDLRGRRIAGLCATTFKALAERVGSITLRAAGMQVLEARRDGRALRFTHKGDRLSVRLDRTLRAGEEAVLELRYRIRNPTTGAHFVGPGPESPRAPLQMWSQGQPEDAHYWFPCHDAPHEKATSEIVATVPRGFVAVSNGALIERRAAGGRELFHWRMHHPHALYLVSLAVGRFAEIKQRWEDVEVVYYCERGREEDARRGFAATVPALEFFSDYFGVRYPYEKYAQVAVAEFPGGMENTTCTTQTDACLLNREAALDTDMDLIVSHELAHHWFGDLLTCRDWSHAWLNEGFATYCEMLFLERAKGRDEADHELERNRQSYLGEDAHRYRRPVVSNRYRYPWVLFDRHLYEKGGWVVHMLRYLLDEEDFRRSLRLYLTRHRNGSVETGDLAAAIEAATGRNLRRFFDQWVLRPGYPHYAVDYRWDAKGRRAELRVRQTQAAGSGGGALYHMPVAFRFTGANGRWEREFTETVDKKEHVFHWRLPGEPAMAEFDPAHWILKKLEFRKPDALWLAELRGARTAMSRSRAAWRVAAWGCAESVAALERAVRSDPYWGTAAEAAKALGSIRSDAAFAALRRLLPARHPKIRRAVVGALAQFANSRAAAAAAPLLERDPSIHVRAEAARALGAARDRRWAGRLRRALARPSWRDVVAAGALSGLAELRDPGSLPLLRRLAAPPTGFPLRAHAIRALGRYAGRSEAVVDWLCEALGSRDERILMAAIDTLGGTGDRRAVEPLKRLRDRHTDTRVKSYADEAIARLTHEEAKP